MEWKRCNCRVTDLACSKTIASVDAAFILARYMKFIFITESSSFVFRLWFFIIIIIISSFLQFVLWILIFFWFNCVSFCVYIRNIPILPLEPGMSLSERFFHFFVSEDSPQRCFGDSGAGNWRSYQILLYIFEMTRASEGGFLSPPRWWIENQSCLCELCDTPHCIQMYRTWCFIRQIPFLIQKKSYVPPSSNQFVLFLLPIPCTSVYFRVLPCTSVYFRLLPCTLLKRFWFFYLPIFDIFTRFVSWHWGRLCFTFVSWWRCTVWFLIYFVEQEIKEQDIRYKTFAFSTNSYHHGRHPWGGQGDISPLHFQP